MMQDANAASGLTADTPAGLLQPALVNVDRGERYGSEPLSRSGHWMAAGGRRSGFVLHCLKQFGAVARGGWSPTIAASDWRHEAS